MKDKEDEIVTSKSPEFKVGDIVECIKDNCTQELFINCCYKMVDIKNKKIIIRGFGLDHEFDINKESSNYIGNWFKKV